MHHRFTVLCRTWDAPSRSQSVCSSQTRSPLTPLTPTHRDPNVQVVPKPVEYWSQTKVIQQPLPTQNMVPMPPSNGPIHQAPMSSMHEVKPPAWSVAVNYSSVDAPTTYVTIGHQGPVHPQMNYPSSYYQDSQQWLGQKHHESIPPGYPTTMTEAHSPVPTRLTSPTGPVVKIEPRYSSSPQLRHHQPVYAQQTGVQQRMPVQMHPSPQMHHHSPPIMHRQPMQQLAPMDHHQQAAMYGNLVHPSHSGP
jgi:hypothetical protein